MFILVDVFFIDPKIQSKEDSSILFFFLIARISIVNCFYMSNRKNRKLNLRFTEIRSKILAIKLCVNQ